MAFRMNIVDFDSDSTSSCSPTRSRGADSSYSESAVSGAGTALPPAVVEFKSEALAWADMDDCGPSVAIDRHNVPTTMFVPIVMPAVVVYPGSSNLTKWRIEEERNYPGNYLGGEFQGRSCRRRRQCMPEASEEEWASRRSKRRECLDAILASQDYAEFIRFCVTSGRKIPKHPDPAARVSKRQWEARLMEFRQTLKS